MANKHATVASLLGQATASLRGAGVDSPELTAERLLMHVLRCQRADLYLAPERPLSHRQQAWLADLLARRRRHEPLQYLTGEVEFMGLSLLVRPGVLIPRPETETLVERAVAFCQRELHGLRPVRCLDVGTGCGNIAASVATLLPHAEVVAIDCSEEALAVARENLRRLRLTARVQLVRADLRRADFARRVRGTFHLVTANLPYVPTGELATLAPEVKNHEPRMALDGGPDGLGLYRLLIPLLPQLISPGGGYFAEIGVSQAFQLRSLLESAGLVQIEVLPDLAGRERVVFARTPRERA
ncbi:MAG: peptide chain release factor N(5)-glutamine methyltransferase [Candidatus Oleimicrobiaceae bacterium]